MNNIGTDIFFRFLSVVVSKDYLTNAITLRSVCGITVDTVEMVKMRHHANLAVIDNNTTIFEVFDFQDGSRRHVEFLNFENFNRRNAQETQTASPCQILWRSVKPLLSYGDFSIFQDGGRPPSWTCDACFLTTHEGHLVVFITVQNLVGIDAIVLIICMFFDFVSFA